MDSSSPDAVIHGVLLNIGNAGVLIIGESGTGKSDCALELLSRGARLVADDVVEIERVGAKLVGKAPERFAGLLEVRGLGIVDVRKFFRDGYEPDHKVDICIEFQDRAASEHLERLGNKSPDIAILGVKIPKYTLPAGYGRNLPLLVETIVKLSQTGGLTAESDLAAAHDELVSAFAR